ncbi:fungal hydrophobin [Apiospora hydei]|uniref:Fungal hydrophobin n=1 Tax=Apiospora hydei TaxID=1337664 RepID=A0ABR1V6C6_9PEZI
MAAPNSKKDNHDKDHKDHKGDSSVIIAPSSSYTATDPPYSTSYPSAGGSSNAYPINEYTGYEVGYPVGGNGDSDDKKDKDDKEKDEKDDKKDDKHDGDSTYGYPVGARTSHDSKHDKDTKNGNYGSSYPVGDDTTSHDSKDINNADDHSYGSYPTGGNYNGPAACKSSKSKFGKRNSSKAMCCQLDVMGLVSTPCQDASDSDLTATQLMRECSASGLTGMCCEGEIPLFYIGAVCTKPKRR